MRQEKIKLLVTFVSTHIGGAMTSLVNFLNCLDTDVYDVDVLFYEIRSEGRFGIKDEINILPQAKKHNRKDISNVLKKVFSTPYVWAKIREIYFEKVKKNNNASVQVMSKQGARFVPSPRKEYDIALS